VASAEGENNAPGVALVAASFGWLGDIAFPRREAENCMV